MADVTTTHDDQGSETYSANADLVDAVGHSAEGRRWLADLPALIDQFRIRWSLRIGTPMVGGVAAWVAPALLPSGDHAVLKLSWPHREAAGEATVLRWWNGHSAVRLLDCDQDAYALLMEHCDPGEKLTSANHLSAEERLTIGATLLAELWSTPGPPPDGSPPDGLERVADVTAEWADEVDERFDHLRTTHPDVPVDPGLVALGSRLLRELPATASREVVVHGDFNPGNILSATRRPWLAIDPKPMLGDPGYDPFPLLEQIDDPFAHPDPADVLTSRFTHLAEILDEPADRLIAWSIARRVESALWAYSQDDLPGTLHVLTEAHTLAALL